MDSGRRPLGAVAVVALVLVAYVAIVCGFFWYALDVVCPADPRFSECGWDWFYGFLGVVTLSPVAVAIVVATLWQSRGKELPGTHQLFVIASSLFTLVAWLWFMLRWRSGDSWLAVIVPVIVIVVLLRIGAGQHASWRDDADESQG